MVLALRLADHHCLCLGNTDGHPIYFWRVVCGLVALEFVAGISLCVVYTCLPVLVFYTYDILQQNTDFDQFNFECHCFC